ncbi:hypothetical protein ASPBRDRAFT_200609 [Aspergillus brasiliensis CBS 101740]|uniref:Uncharacterized protein n=1 Tax=Aspergillus brasiliensis (strain CBS 101740 / IMI 381727 / IBT 21946) TaxID=767769 RepID=A0A1L9U5P2_ASPBC|nr:hypothetical protein ASPBRDRAFT_200609 [Aspergillus brasiliensis CBS 101740]
MSFSAVLASTVCLASCAASGEPSLCTITILPLTLLVGLAAIGRIFPSDSAAEDMVHDAPMGRRRLYPSIEKVWNPTKFAQLFDARNSKADEQLWSLTTSSGASSNYRLINSAGRALALHAQLEQPLIGTDAELDAISSLPL